MTVKTDLDESVAKALTASRIVGNKNSYKADNPGESAKVFAYLNGGVRPLASAVATDMGKHLVALEDGRRGSVVVPPVEPPTTVVFGSRPAYSPPSMPQFGPGQFKIENKHVKNVSLDLQGFSDLVFIDCDFDDAMVYMLNCNGTITATNCRFKNARHNAFQFNQCRLQGTVSNIKVKGGESEDVFSVINGGGVDATHRLIFENFHIEGGDGVATKRWISGSGSGLMTETASFVTYRNFTLLNPGQVGFGAHLGGDIIVQDFSIHTEQSYPRPQVPNLGDIAYDAAQSPQTNPLTTERGKVQWFRQNGTQASFTVLNNGANINGFSTNQWGYPFSQAEIAAMRVIL